MVYAVIRDEHVRKDLGDHVSEKVLKVLGSYIERDTPRTIMYVFETIINSKKPGFHARNKRRYPKSYIEKFLKTKKEAEMLIGALKL